MLFPVLFLNCLRTSKPKSQSAKLQVSDGRRKDPSLQSNYSHAIHFATWYLALFMSPKQSSSTEHQLREYLSNTIGERPYQMWFSSTTVECDDESIKIVAATKLAASWITDRFTPAIQDAVKHTCGRDVSFYISYTETTQSQETRNSPKLPSYTAPKARSKKLLTFDDFIVGSCNQLACAAAKQITQEDGRSISPLLIHGACGVGKTHILQAICSMASKTTKSKVRYVTAEQFTNEFIASSRSGEFSRFRARYRNLDLLAIDDVHFVSNKMKTQEELLHTLDAVGLRGARLVLASDEEPRHIRRLNQALANRLVAGLIAEIQRPDRETRCNIIKKLANQHSISITDGAIDQLASQAVGSVREIEGKVTRLRAIASLLITNEKTIIDVDAVNRLLRTIPPTSLPIRVHHILEATATRAGLSTNDLKGASRASNIVFWRSIASYLGRNLTSLSFQELADAIGRKNHSTVHAAVKRVTEILHQPDTLVKIKNR